MSDKFSYDELRGRLIHCPAHGTRFRHYKTGGLYTVVGSAIAEATQEPLVIYHPDGSPLLFARPLKEWRELVFHDGRAVERFRCVEVAPAGRGGAAGG